MCSYNIPNLDLFHHQVRNLLQRIAPGLFRPELLSKAQFPQHVEHQPFKHLRHIFSVRPPFLASLLPILFLAITDEQLYPPIHVPRNQRARCPQALLREGQIQQVQQPPSLCVHGRLYAIGGMFVVLVSLPRLVELAAFDVRASAVNVCMRAGGVEEDEIGFCTKLVAVALEVVVDPFMAVAFAGVVEGGEGADAAEEWAGGAGERVEEELVDGCYKSVDDEQGNGDRNG